jgi:hypothetical protein
MDQDTKLKSYDGKRGNAREGEVGGKGKRD